MQLLNKLEILIDLYPEQLWLEFSEKDKQINWQKSQEHSYEFACFQGYLNRLSSEIFINWLREDADIEENPQLNPNLEQLNIIWEFLNGTNITIGKTKIILIPFINHNFDQFYIPQEWVDIPGWEADYYLPIQLNLTDNWLRVWGYITHDQLKNTGQYNSLEKNYILEKDDLIEDLNIMLVAREFCDTERTPPLPVPKINDSEADALIENWGVNNGYSPRFIIPFPHWANIISNESWRQKLYKKFINSQENNNNLLENQLREKDTRYFGDYQTNLPIKKINENIIEINNWLEGIFIQDWLKVENVFTKQKINFATRSLNNKNHSNDNLEKKVIASKLIDLGIKIGNVSILLLMACVPKNEDKMMITVQVYPCQGDNYLPPHLKLSALDEDDNLIQNTVVSRHHDKLIQLKHFTVPHDVKFSLEISLDETTWRENFIIKK